MKSTLDEIRQRFDADVEQFSNLETGRSTTVDAPLAMAPVNEAAAATTPHARHVLDVGCGAGNGLRPRSIQRFLSRLPLTFQPGKAAKLNAVYHFTFTGQRRGERPSRSGTVACRSRTATRAGPTCV